MWQGHVWMKRPEWHCSENGLESVPLCCCPAKFCNRFRAYEEVLGIQEEFLKIYFKLFKKLEFRKFQLFRDLWINRVAEQREDRDSVSLSQSVSAQGGRGRESRNGWPGTKQFLLLPLLLGGSVYHWQICLGYLVAGKGFNVLLVLMLMLKHFPSK